MSGAQGIGRRARLLVVAAVISATLAAPAPAGADGDEAPGAPAAFRALTAGTDHSCAILDGGAVKCWGKNNRGQLGIGTTTNRGTTVSSMTTLPDVELGTGRTATALAAGEEHTCALLDDATVKCWGSAYYGQLGQGEGLNEYVLHNRGDQADEMGDDLPIVDLGSGRTATAIAVGGNTSCALLDDSTVKCWGSNWNGQAGVAGDLGVGDQPGEMGDALPPIALGSGRTATAVTAGQDHVCALLDNGQLKCWGRNGSGQLGQGDTADRGLGGAPHLGDNLPAIPLGSGRTAVAAAAGQRHTCALLDNGRIKCWGRNTTGSLGIGDTHHRGDEPGEMGDKLPAVGLGTGRTATAVAAGASHTCARLDTGGVKCWGDNVNAQLGVEDKVNRGDQPGQMGDALPRTRLGTGLRADAVVAGGDHSCARLEDGTFRCWGTSVFGGLGIGFNVTVQGGVPGAMGPGLPRVLVTPAPAPVTTGVSGTVTQTGTGDELNGIWVVLLRTDDFTIAGSASTNSQGRYEALAPPASYYLYLIDPTGRHDAGFVGSPTTIVVTGGPPIAIDPAMAPNRGAVGGTITEEGSGTPIGGSWVITLNGTTGAPQVGAVADAAGNYAVDDLVPGGRFVIAIDPTGSHHPRYSPATPSILDATPVPVSAGSATDADVALPPQSVGPGGAALTGTVTASGTGLPLAGAFVIALRASDYTLAGGTRTSSSGTYNLEVDPVGHHLVFFDPSGRHQMEWHDDQPASGLDAATVVTAPANTNATLTPAGGTLAGTLSEDVLGDPVPTGWVFAIGPNGIAGATSTAADGSYTIPHLPPGTYRAAFVDRTGAWAQEYWHNRPDYFSAGVLAVNAGAVTPLYASLART